MGPLQPPPVIDHLSRDPGARTPVTDAAVPTALGGGGGGGSADSAGLNPIYRRRPPPFDVDFSAFRIVLLNELIHLSVNG